MITRINSDLANGIGNLLSRTLTMIERYCRRHDSRDWHTGTLTET